MRNRLSIRALLAVGALGVFAGPALAAPTATRITAPADPSYITFPATGPTSLVVTGTSNGKTAKVDLRCDGTVGLVVKANVAPNAAGDFSTTITAATMAKLVAQSCVLRAVPAGYTSM